MNFNDILSESGFKFVDNCNSKLISKGYVKCIEYDRFTIRTEVTPNFRTLVTTVTDVFDNVVFSCIKDIPYNDIVNADNKLLVFTNWLKQLVGSIGTNLRCMH